MDIVLSVCVCVCVCVLAPGSIPLLDRAAQALSGMLQVEDDGGRLLSAGEARVPSHHICTLLKQAADVQGHIDELQAKQRIRWIGSPGQC